MELKAIALVLACTMTLISCVTLPQDAPGYAAAPVPLAAPAGYATVYIYRIGARPVKRAPDVLVSGMKVWEPPEQAFTWAHVKAGKRQFKLDWASDTGSPDTDVVLELQAGQTYHVRVSGARPSAPAGHYAAWYGDANVHLVSRLDAERELAACCKFMKPLVGRID